MNINKHLLEGHVIPAIPLALTAERKLDEERQRGLARYYVSAGSGGLAVGVHSTQFAIRDPEINLFRHVLDISSRAIDEAVGNRPFIKVAGICGRTDQALKETRTALELGYHAGLLSLAAFAQDPDTVVLNHCHEVAKSIPVIGFYLQPAVGGRVFSYDFWRGFAEIPGVVAVKIAPFNRYQTLNVVRAVVEAGRDDIALYTGNDDNIIIDLFTKFRFRVGGRMVERRIVGGLLGQWAVWTKTAVKMLEAIKIEREKDTISAEWLTRAAELTDANAAVFDAANRFQGCIPGIHEVLRRQGLLAGTWCLDPDECLSPGQAEELDRVMSAYPHLTDGAA